MEKEMELKKELELERARNKALVESNNKLRDAQAASNADESLKKSMKNSPYDDWAQLNLAPDSLNALLSCGPGALKIFIWLVKEMDKENALTCSNTAIREALDMSRASVTRALADLRQQNIIKIYRVGSAHTYALNHEVVWKSYGNNIWQSKFTSLVVLSKAEQEKAEKTGVVEQRHPPKRAVYPTSQVLKKDEAGD